MNDYFQQRLHSYLSEEHPDLIESMNPVEFSAFLTTRAEAAAGSFEQARRAGADMVTAEELAQQTLRAGLDSPYPFLVDFLQLHFPEIHQRLEETGQIRPVALALESALRPEVILLRRATGKEKTLREYALIGLLQTRLSEHGL